MDANSQRTVGGVGWRTIDNQDYCVGGEFTGSKPKFDSGKSLKTPLPPLYTRIIPTRKTTKGISQMPASLDLVFDS